MLERLLRHGLEVQRAVQAREPLADEVAADATVEGNAIVPVYVSSQAVTITPPVGPYRGTWFAVVDSRANAGTNAISVDFSGGNYHGARWHGVGFRQPSFRGLRLSQCRRWVVKSPMMDKSMTRRTAQHEKTFLEAFEKSLGVVTTACKQAGVGRRTFYNWWTVDPTLREQMDEMTEVALDFAETKLFNQIETGNITAIDFYLITKGKKFGYVETVEAVN